MRISLALVALGLLQLPAEEETNSPAPFEIDHAPDHTIPFADGSKMEVFQVALDRISIGRTKKPVQISGNWRERGGTIGSTDNEVRNLVFSSKNQIVGHSWEGQPSSLLLLCRFRDKKDQPIIPKRFLWGRGMKGDDISLRERDALPTPDQMIKGPKHELKLPEFMIQLKDTDGQWINSDGPLCEADGSLGIVAFRVWPKHLPKLSFRSLARGQPPVNWVIPNPFHPVKKAQWKVDTLPKSFDRPEFSFDLNGVNPVEGQKRMVSIDFDFESQVFGDDQVGPNSQSLEAELVEIEGSLGGRYKPGWLRMNRYSISDVIELPADEDLLKAHFKVSPTRDYRYHRDETFELVSGVISNDGKSVQIAPHQLKQYGLSRLEIDLLPGDYPSIRWDLSFAFKDPKDEAKAKEDLLLEDGRLVCFINEEKYSSGNLDTISSGYSGAGTESSIARIYSWTGTPVKLVEGNTTSYTRQLPKPGSTVTLAVSRPRQAITFSFVVPRPKAN